MKKTLCRIIAAILITAVILAAILAAGEMTSTDKTWRSFYSLDKNSIDVVLIGASGLAYYYQQSQAYGERGYTSYNLTSAAQPYELITTIMDEALRFQDPDLFVVEIRSIASVEDKYENAKPGQSKADIDYEYRQVLWGLLDPFSPYRWKSILKFRKEMTLENFLESCFPLLGYHENVYDLENIASNLRASWKKYYGTPDITITTDYTERAKEQSRLTQNSTYHADEAKKAALDEIYSKAQACGKPVLFLMTPYLQNEIMYSIQNELVDYMREQGYDYLDCRGLENEIGLDYGSDFYDLRHVNVIGAHKFTSWFAEYLDEHYDLSKNYSEASSAAWDDLAAGEKVLYQRRKSIAEEDVYIENSDGALIPKHKQPEK